ncbi:MAG: sodium:proline symporter [Bradymonadaceae bacterium]
MSPEVIEETPALNVNWRGVILGALIAALTFLVIFMATAPLMGLHTFEPIQMMAAIVLGPQILDRPPTFDLGVFAVAMAIHLILSLLYTSVIAVWVRERPPTQALGLGLLLGMAIYMLNFYVFIPAYPWFYAARDLITIAIHLVFGGVAAAVYVAIEQGWRRVVPQT